LKNSGEVKINEEICLNVLSVFDRDNWRDPTDPNVINIGLHHGSISNCRTDAGWTMQHGENEISIFDEFDYAFLGDIHKTNQALDDAGKIRYPGSTVQQNFGETNDKGFLIWDIQDKENFTVKHVVIPNPKPFVTINLTRTGRLPKNAECPLGARIRLVSENSLPVSTMKRAMDAAKHRFKPESIGYLNRSAGQRGNVEELATDDVEENLRDVTVQEKLIKEYLKDFEPTDEQLEAVFKLNRKCNATLAEKEDVQRNINWNLRTMHWNNLFNYGEGNSIDFDKLNGIVGIFGKNFSGKSSVIDSMLYTIFNSTSKNERKNLNIINQNKEEADGIVTIDVGHKRYTIERKSEKYVKKLKGEETLEAKTDILFKVRDMVTDEETILNGTTRNETDAIIRNHFGNVDDFLMTSMSSQIDSLRFINEGSTKRKEALAKFLDLQFFERKYKLIKDEAADLRGALRKAEDIDYDSEIYEIEKQIMFSENKITEQNEMCESLNRELMSLQLDKKDLETKIDSIPAEVIDICEVLKHRNKQEQDISTYNSNVSNCNVILAEKNELLAKIAKFEESFDIVSVKNQKDEIDEKLLKISNLLTELENAEKLKELNEKKVQLLGEVPCGDKFKSCKFIKDAHCSKETLVDLIGQVQSINNEKEKAERLLNRSNEEKINSHLENYKKLMEKRREAERIVLKTDLEKGKWENSALSAQNELQRINILIDDYNKNKSLIENKETFTLQLTNVAKEIAKKQKSIDKCRTELQSLHRDNGSLTQQAQTLQEKKEWLHNLQNDITAFDLLMKCMHPNGIAYDIIKKKLPIINDEMSRILANVVDFEIFFEAEEKRLNIFIKHPKYDRRPIEMGSGAEKTLAAMAIRLALLSVSSLPKSNIFILDEPGTALDAENMDGFISILELIKTYFKTVILISHLDHLKDCVDQQITIDKKEGFAHIMI
jgi:exonuclease SbcC